MNLLLRRCLRTLVLMMLLCAGLLAWQLVDYWRLSGLERELAAVRTAPPPATASAAAVLARAQVLVRERGPGAGDAALELYRQVEAEAARCCDGSPATTRPICTCGRPSRRSSAATPPAPFR